MSARNALTDVKHVLRSATENAERVLDKEIREYSNGTVRPLRSYALFMTAYGAAVGSAVLVGRRRGVRPPARIGAGDLALLALGTHRLSRLLAKDSITAVVRAPFTRYVDATGAGEVEEEVRGSGLRHAIGELL